MSELEKNNILFENLIHRLVHNETSGQYSLPGVITANEREALMFAMQQMEDSKIANVNQVETPNPSELTHQEPVSTEPIPDNLKPEPVIPKDTPVPFKLTNVFKPISTPLKPEPIPELTVTSEGIEKILDTSILSPNDFLPDIKLGLDFGTAYSKACMVQVENGEENILDLPLGIYAGEDAMEMPVHSSLFIDVDGRLYFGPIAVEKSLDARGKGVEISRIDSIKSFLIDENRVTIDDSPLSKAFNPTDTAISKAALLTFYLGYMIYLAKEAARDRHDIDISKVKRRISLPCYEPNHREKVIKELSKLFMLGEVLGGSFRDEWEQGFRIEDVMYLYNWMREHIKKKSPYIECFLEEPLAVASSRIGLNGKALGNVCIIVDVGAGTTDFTMFEIFANAKTKLTNAKQIKGSEYGIPVAGDKLDSLLLAHILEDANITRSNENYRETLVSLRLDIRDYKERLFRTNKLTYSLPNSVTGQISLSNFMQDQSIRDFTKELQNAFIHVLSSIHKSWIKTKIKQKNMNGKLPVILTGGGANLPMIRNLAKGIINIDGYPVDLFLSPSIPSWIEDEYEGEIIDLYPQLAVSLGSAMDYVIQKTGVVEEYT
jgi:molecular chaperone HscA